MESVIIIVLDAGATVDATVEGLRNPGHVLLTGPCMHGLLTSLAVVTTGSTRQHTEHRGQDDIS